ncbi:unnamed protein product, partial [Ectocarpus sp. 4 AP-2014]
MLSCAFPTDSLSCSACLSLSLSLSLLCHQNSDYRLLVACCLVEVLRIFAPDAPYTDDQVLATLSLIITQLRGLGTAAT